MMKMERKMMMRMRQEMAPQMKLVMDDAGGAENNSKLFCLLQVLCLTQGAQKKKEKTRSASSASLFL